MHGGRTDNLDSLSVNMAEHNELGHVGEDIATTFLSQKGFVIRERNWRCRHKEVDIIAMDGATLVFVEVKTRSSDAVSPSDLITYQKIRYLETAAESYIRRTGFNGDARFDVVIIHKKRSGYDIDHIPNAFR